MGSNLRAGHNAAVPSPHHKRARFVYERRVQLFSLFLTLPGLAAIGVLIWWQDWNTSSKLSLLFLAGLVYWMLTLALHEHVTRPLQTLANVIAALREEDYSFRLRGVSVNDAFGGLSGEVNELADLLSSQRSRAIEASALLRRVVEEIEAPLFAFDPGHALVLVNPAGEKLLQKSSAALLGNTAEEIGLSHLLSAENESVISLPPGGSSPQWLLRKSSFRQSGVPHVLVVLADVSRALRDQERTAWQRLVRVLGHELNNSLAPIKSIAGTLSARISGTTLNHEQRQDFTSGLEIIEARAGSLNRFVEAYRRLAQMPRPVLQEVSLAPIARRVAGLETRVPVTVISGQDITLAIDPDQIEQMLINLVRNAAEAALEGPIERKSNAKAGTFAATPSSSDLTSASQAAEPQRTVDQIDQPEVCLRWEVNGAHLLILIEDNGPGLANPGNAFVPFYTTKAGGSGIGLALSRQIAEAHGGSVELTNRQARQGCLVKVLLPANPDKSLSGS